MTHRLLLTLAVCAAALLGLSQATPTIAAERPNVIFFLSDDQRNDFLGCAGHPILKTPTIDRLAAAGVRFENAFVTTSICAASRATLFSGQWERTHRYTFGTPPLAEELVNLSYPAVLREAGYRTGFVGKFGVNMQKDAKEKMFDFFVPMGRNPYFREQPDGSLRHFTEVAGDRAVEFLRECPADQPFCLSVSFNAAHASDGDKVNHYPYPKAEEGLYEDITIPQPRISTDFWKQLPGFFHDCMHRDRWFWRWDTPEKYQRNVKSYYRMITGLDRVMGDVLEEVERLGRADNTVVIFMGDNGYYKGSRGFAGKWSHFEESLRVPLVIYDPRLPAAKRGRVLKPMALNVDIPATILDLAGQPMPKTYQGRSLVPLVCDKQSGEWRDDFFCEHLMNNAKIPKYEGVRGERYVYARYFEHPEDGEFLHDLQTDPDQLKNFVSDPAYGEVLEKMRRRCNELRDELGGPYRKPEPRRK
ncbi:MAG: sulfatase [Thermoguttaceae bacterium]